MNFAYINSVQYYMDTADEGGYAQVFRLEQKLCNVESGALVNMFKHKY